MSGSLTGTRTLLGALVRHDGQRFAPWIILPTALSVSSVLVYPWIFPDMADRTALAAAVGSNPALGLIFGPAYDLSTVDGFNSWRSLALGGFLAALGTIFSVTRATRAQEDSGQAELLASGVMGRSARLVAASWMALAGSLLLGVVAGLLTVASGGGWEDSMLLGFAFSGTGWMFAAVAAVAAQIGSDARSANSIAVGTLGALFLARGFLYSIDAPEWTTWVNPLGWIQETRPATGNHWWPLALAVGFTVAGMVLAFVLQSRRDFGQGAIAPRPGASRGAYRTTWRLALRQSRGPFLTWAIAFVALGFVFGFFATSIYDLLGSDLAVQQAIAGGAVSPDVLVGAFVGTILSMVGIVASVSGVQTMVRVRSEEMNDRVEPIVATATTRRRYYASNLIAALSGPTLLMLIAGTIVSMLAASADIGVELGDALLQTVATVPAVWTVVALAAAVIGARPNVPVAAWFGVLLSFAITLLGPTFKLPDWALGISPFWHVPTVMQPDPQWSGLIWITLVTLLFVGIGLAGFGRRDLAVTSDTPLRGPARLLAGG